MPALAAGTLILVSMKLFDCADAYLKNTVGYHFIVMANDINGCEEKLRAHLNKTCVDTEFIQDILSTKNKWKEYTNGIFECIGEIL